VRLNTIVRALRDSLWFLWPAAVSASPLTFGQSIEQVTAFEWVLVAVLSTLSGVTALLLRISNQVNEDPPRPINHLWLLAASHMCGSWLAGLMAFFGASHFHMAGMITGLFVPAVSFGGAKSCELIYTSVMSGKFRIKMVSTGQEPKP
jgi:hypothetical protein